LPEGVLKLLALFLLSGVEACGGHLSFTCNLGYFPKNTLRLTTKLDALDFLAVPGFILLRALAETLFLADLSTILALVRAAVLRPVLNLGVAATHLFSSVYKQPPPNKITLFDSKPTHKKKSRNHQS